MISISLALISLIGLAVSSFSYVQRSALAFVIASWVKPFATIGFVAGLGILYWDIIKRSKLRAIALALVITAFFFILSFFLNSVLFRDSVYLFPGIHSYVFIPSVIAALLMLIVSIYAKPQFQPFTSRIESVGLALLPMFLVIAFSVAVSVISAGRSEIQWLSRDYLIKPAIIHSPSENATGSVDDVIYTGPMKVDYSVPFMKLYKELLRTGVEVSDFGNFSDNYLFIVSENETRSLVAYSKDGTGVEKIRNADHMYHSDTELAVVDSSNNSISVFNTSLQKLYDIPYPQTVKVEKIIFSKELFAVHYLRPNGTGHPYKFSIIYRSDTGSRAGRIDSEDIAPRLRTTGFLVVSNEKDGLYLTVMDRNSNKRRYLFKGGSSSNARVVQCGADRFYVSAEFRSAGGILKRYVLVYDISRFRKLHESLKDDGTTDLGKDSIIAITEGYYLTDTMRLLDNNLDEVARLRAPSDLPYRIHVSPEKRIDFTAEGAIRSLDLSPSLKAVASSPDIKVILADMKGTLIIKEVIKFRDYIFVMTNNRIFIYDENMHQLKRIDLAHGGYINRVRIGNDNILLTYDSEDQISIYSIDPDLNEKQLAVINTRRGKIWDISDQFLVYGYGSRPSTEPDSIMDSAVLIAKGIVTDKVYQRIVVPSLRTHPSVEGERLLLPFRYFTETVNIRTGKRTVLEGTLQKADDMRYGVTGTGLLIDLSDLKTLPFSLDPRIIGNSPVSRGRWLDLNGYLIAPEEGTTYEVVRSGRTTLGEDSICSSIPAAGKILINCVNLNTTEISASISVSSDYDIVYSDPDIIFLKDNHSLIAIETEHNHQDR
ncbi:MAG: hypothetical protein JSV21_03130 [Nitrospirota bacterium]|nr:MAG: hypothetical protein JSV21_03130 [Nitrospirota bacterium]